MLMLNWISSACIVLAGQAGPLYMNTTISMLLPQLKRMRFLSVGGGGGGRDCVYYSLFLLKKPNIVLEFDWDYFII